MNDALIVTQLLVQLVTLGTLGYALYRMFAITEESRASRARAEAAATLAAEKASLTAVAITRVAENVQKIETATNSMKDALVQSTAKASDLEGEKRGIAIAEAKAADKGTKP